ncbi:hypothetical protein M011DRAFT_397244 [Sporormia fimetaria CBS 119925]|uniref:Uncharacterized protein n=1 Tax=Sporormia fimetaria CBS 119925 TaxID=1340428 RepID=A0A6A6VL03_9PLEO|nr:hypothetical protein M011DRAFT_397244 [Sporormia fimetaria CBS 119925]
MTPPWVQFDSIASAGGTCIEGSDPDIAGIGVVISFVLASIMTTSASIIAMLLDHAHEHKADFSIADPEKYLKDHVLPTQWKKEYAWRPFLDPLIIGLGDQQLVAQGSFEVQGAHFVVILYICALSSSSHLAALITLRKFLRKYRLVAKIRVALVIIFAIFLIGSMLASIAMPIKYVADHKGGEPAEAQYRVQQMTFLFPMFFIVFGFSTALVCILYRPHQKHSPGIGDIELRPSFPIVPARRRLSRPTNVVLRLICNLFLNPLVTFTVQILLATLSVVLVLSQKFSTPNDKEKWCELQDRGENAWGFGQTLSVVMLLLPAMSAGQMYLEGR